MVYDYFVASRWRNKDDVQRLVAGLRDQGKRVYSFVEAAESVYAEYGMDSTGNPEVLMAFFENLPAWRAHPLVRRIFDQDMDALRKSESFVLLLPAGKSAHIEAGTAYGLGKRLIQIGNQKAAESLYLIFDRVSPDIDAFLSNPDVR